SSLLFFFLFQLKASFAEDFILDPGHSPAHPGALSCSGRYEHLYNEDLATTVLRYLKERGLSVTVTRSAKEDISLISRAQMAKGKKLFLSLHHDSAQKKYLSIRNAFPCTDTIRGYSLFVSAKNAYFESSLLYARILGEILTTMGFRPSTHHGEPIAGENRPLLDARLGIYQFDDLVVLKKADSPAILLEAAVIVNPDDDVLSQNKTFQLRIAEAIAQTFRFVTVQSPYN
ncbi:MAG: N-acetylmuramoyl-L-alanine amidase, partial [Desulfovibrio sp.]|nr:N-acetylmuramoyl-L-alanine amidase [Desulfovibrio sp.]